MPLIKLATMTKGLFKFQEVIVNIRLLQTFFSNSLYYLSLYRNEDEKISSSSTNSSSSRPRVERSSSTRIVSASARIAIVLSHLPSLGDCTRATSAPTNTIMPLSCCPRTAWATCREVPRGWPRASKRYRCSRRRCGNYVMSLTKTWISRTWPT